MLYAIVWINRFAQGEHGVLCSNGQFVHIDNAKKIAEKILLFTTIQSVKTFRAKSKQKIWEKNFFPAEYDYETKKLTRPEDSIAA